MRAADAAFALAKLAPLEEQGSLLVEPVFSKDSATDEASMDSTKTESVTLDDTRVMGARTFTRGRSASVGSAMPAVGRSLLWAERGELPPVPEDWKGSSATAGCPPARDGTRNVRVPKLSRWLDVRKSKITSGRS